VSISFWGGQGSTHCCNTATRCHAERPCHPERSEGSAVRTSHAISNAPTDFTITSKGVFQHEDL